MNVEKQTSWFPVSIGIGTGILFLIYAVMRVIDRLPNFNTDTAGFYDGFVEGNGTIWIISRLTWCFGSILAIGIVLYSKELVQNEENEQLLEFTTTLGIVGFSVHALAFAHQLTSVLIITKTYADLTSSQQATINALGNPLLDTFNLFRGVLPSIWLLSLAYYGNKSNSFPDTLTPILCISAIAFMLLPINNFLLNGMLTIPINASAGIFGPIVMIWLGLINPPNTLK